MNISQTGATLSGSYSSLTGSVSEVGFRWGTSSGNLNNTVSGTLSENSFSANLTGLSAGTTYYYQAYVKVQGTGDKSSSVQTFTSDVNQFTTSPEKIGLLELPAQKSGYFHNGFVSGKMRNYNYCFDTEHYASLWVAYPLTKSHTEGSASTSSWKYDPDISSDCQPAVTGNSYGTVYGNSSYSRGHQCPSGSRKSDDTMNSQTYYVSNQTPQLQNSFNGGIWMSLENDLRTITTSSDTLYIATGPCYQTVGGSEAVTYLTASSSSTVPYKVPVPNYYWKAVLKVKWNGNTVTDSCAIGFWFEHNAYSGTSSTNYVVTLDEIEAKIGFDLFANLPDSIEAKVESTSTTWAEFTDY